MVTHSSILAWTEEPGGLRSIGLQRVVHDNTRRQACHDQSVSGPHPISADHGAAPPMRCSEARSPYSRASESRSVVSDSLRPHGLYSPWNSPGQNTGVGSFSLLQGIVPTQGSKPGLQRCRRILYQQSHRGSPHSPGGPLRNELKILHRT